MKTLETLWRELCGGRTSGGGGGGAGGGSGSHNFFISSVNGRPITSGGSITLTGGVGGRLRIQSDGNYSYTSPPTRPDRPQVDVFRYSIQRDDGREVQTTLRFRIDPSGKVTTLDG